MPRDANGNYTLPAGNPVVAGTTIQTSWANPTMDDLGAEIQDSLSRSGKGAMTAPLAITGAGTAIVRLSNDGVNKAVLNSDGNAANQIGLQINSVEAVTVANDNVKIGGALGVGITPEPVQNNFETIRIGGTGAVTSFSINRVTFSENAYRDATDSRWERIVEGESSALYLAGGGFIFETAVSGAPNSEINWSEKVRIDINGNVGIGTNSPQDLLHVNGGNLQVESDNDGNTGIIAVHSSTALAGQIYGVGTELRRFVADKATYFAGGAERWSIGADGAQTWTSNDAQRAVRSTGNNRNAITFDSGTGTASVGTSGTTFRLYAGEFVSTAGSGGGLSLNTANGRVTISDSTNLYGSGRLGVNVATTETTALQLLSRGVSTNNAILVTGGSGYTEEQFKVAFNGKATFLALHDIEPLSSGMRHFTSGRQMLALNNTGTSGAYTVIANPENADTDFRWNASGITAFMVCDASGEGVRIGPTGQGAVLTGARFQVDWGSPTAYTGTLLQPANYSVVYNNNNTEQAYATLMFRVGSSGGAIAQINGIKTGTSAGDLAFNLQNTAIAEVFRLLAAGGVAIPLLPSTNPGAGSKQIWYDPSDGNRVKYAP